MTRRARALLFAGPIGVVVLSLALFLVAREGGCDRSPPDDGDEPVPADCKPGDKECYGAEPTSTSTGAPPG